MFPLEPLFCPCCTPALLHALAQSDLARMPRQMLWLGTGTLSAVIKRQQQARLPITNLADPIANNVLVVGNKGNAISAIPNSKFDCSETLTATGVYDS